MNNSQRAAAERLVDNMNLSLETWIEQAENLLRELLAEPVQEPIARLHDDGHFSWQSYEARRQFDSKHEYEGWAMDVYAAPQQRKPLSDEQVRQIVVEVSTSWAFKRDGPTSMRIARAIECAHGITGEPT